MKYRIAIALSALCAVLSAETAAASSQPLTKKELRGVALFVVNDMSTWMQAEIGQAPHRVYSCRLKSRLRGWCRGVIEGDTQTCKMRVMVFVHDDNRVFGYVRNVRCSEPRRVVAPSRDGR